MKKRILSIILTLGVGVSFITGCGKVVVHDLKGEEVATIDVDETLDIADTTDEVDDEVAVMPISDKYLFFTDCKDQNGDAVDSLELFGKYDVTMVNVWATFCGPCIKEMPELNVLARELEQDNIGLVGVCCDVLDYEGGLDEGQVQLAKDIIAETGVEYTNLMLSDLSVLEKAVNIDAVPTTFFVDKNGAVIGSTQIGAVDNETYTELAHEALILATGK